jgi:hypothetical protein
MVKFPVGDAFKDFVMLVFNDFADFVYEIWQAKIGRIESLSSGEQFSGFIDKRLDIMSIKAHILSLDMEDLSFVGDFRVNSAHEKPLSYYTYNRLDIKACFSPDFIDKGE